MVHKYLDEKSTGFLTQLSHLFSRHWLNKTMQIYSYSCGAESRELFYITFFNHSKLGDFALKVHLDGCCDIFHKDSRWLVVQRALFPLHLFPKVYTHLILGERRNKNFLWFPLHDLVANLSFSFGIDNSAHQMCLWRKLLYNFFRAKGHEVFWIAI